RDGGVVEEGIRRPDKAPGLEADPHALRHGEVEVPRRPQDRLARVLQADHLRPARHGLDDAAVADVDVSVLNGGSIAHEGLAGSDERSGDALDAREGEVARLWPGNARDRRCHVLSSMFSTANAMTRVHLSLARAMARM